MQNGTPNWQAGCPCSLFFMRSELSAQQESVSHFGNKVVGSSGLTRTCTADYGGTPESSLVLVVSRCHPRPCLACRYWTTCGARVCFRMTFRVLRKSVLWCWVCDTPHSSRTNQSGRKGGVGPGGVRSLPSPSSRPLSSFRDLNASSWKRRCVHDVAENLLRHDIPPCGTRAHGP